ncbi:uncharacterized protein EI90DRAFT_1758605 [Cantharellus anzutake]|uniref:uncharacterized protein n=1 Tax=Cantharellus anzutake TaxID=1750568 RepID=UPI0019087036|nr:uncharacterized protein EI90DRAFT_1758605 [Cantharellus anzutake]KAF8341613.1 hypothetical protein EI90DRAFT_1758605 [Cantharellus anzutake]
MVVLEEQLRSVLTLKVFVGDRHPSSSAYSDASFRPLHIGWMTFIGLWGRPLPSKSTHLSWLNLSHPCRTTSSSPQLPEKALFLVCGLDPMMNAIAGPRARDLTLSQMRGALGRLDSQLAQVRKL